MSSHLLEHVFGVRLAYGEGPVPEPVAQASRGVSPFQALSRLSGIPEHTEEDAGGRQTHPARWEPTQMDHAAFADPGRPGVSSPPRRGRPRPPKLYRIGEVVEYSGVSRQTIHNYTTMGLLCEARRTEGGHRLYDEDVFERLDRIAEMKARNKSLEEIREHFTGTDAP